MGQGGWDCYAEQLPFWITSHCFWRETVTGPDKDCFCPVETSVRIRNGLTVLSSPARNR